MPRTSQTRRSRPTARAGALVRGLVGRLRRLPAVLGGRWRAVPLQVLLAEGRRRREVAREMRAGLRQLRALLGEHFPCELRVLVQETVVGELPLAGSTRVVRRADGSRVVFVQVALRVGPRRLGADEVLAALAEQCVALAVEQAGGASVLVPFELRPPTCSGRRFPPSHGPARPPIATAGSTAPSGRSPTPTGRRPRRR